MLQPGGSYPIRVVLVGKSSCLLELSAIKIFEIYLSSLKGTGIGYGSVVPYIP